MTIDSAFAQIRPVLQLAGSALIILGLLQFLGVNVHILNGSGLEIGVAGFLAKNI